MVCLMFMEKEINKVMALSSDAPENIVGTCENLENWMSNLPEKLKLYPIIYLAIPGSHDSTTYGITSKSKIAPDAEALIQHLKFLGCIVRKIMSRWSRTQQISVDDQLLNGVRYFDLRIATRRPIIDDEFYLVHGLYSLPLLQVLRQFQTFLSVHKDEIIILDFQHFYNFHDKDHVQLLADLRSLFKIEQFLPFCDDKVTNLKRVTLNYMTAINNHQIILIYRSNCVDHKGEKILWPSEYFPTPWPRTVSAKKLFPRLDAGLRCRNQDVGFVTQCVLTPTTWFVCKHLFRSLKSKCALPMEKRKYDWLNKQKPGPKDGWESGGLNIVISDFIDYQDCQFSKEIIKLNAKLLDNSVNNTAQEKMTPID